jgi:erythromycin esterase-like protein
MQRNALYRGQGNDALATKLRDLARPLSTADDLDPLLDRIGDARYVLLGEASHGTSDFYTWRARISQRLIREKGFSFIAVEGDWPDCYRVNRFVKGYPEAGSEAFDVLHEFARWPTWMWANWEVVALAEWLRQHNSTQPPRERVGFYGLDVYSLWESLAEVMGYLETNEPQALATARRAYRCFEPFGEDVQRYAQATAFAPASCESEVVALLSELRRQAPEFKDDHEAHFTALQNAQVAVNAERYYRAMVRGGAESWNVRDHHMVQTLGNLMQHHGPEAKAIVWEHNTHIGDARATDMSLAGMVNVGQLVREQHHDEGVVLVGFGSYQGSVIAGSSWGAPMERIHVPVARHGSWEEVLYRSGVRDGLLFSDERRREPGFMEPRGHRAIGVVYNPTQERFGNYVPTVLPQRYDVFLNIAETTALHPLHLKDTDTGEPPDTYPWGV